MGRYGGHNTRLTRPGRGGSGFGSSITGSGAIDRLMDTLGGLRARYQSSRALVLGVIAGLIIAFFVIIIIDFYRVKGLANFQPNITTKIFDQNGELVSELFRQKRDVVPLNRIPRNLINAVIAMEDNEFYDHSGINVKGIVRAFFINIYSGRIRQGGSTITQQLAKILLTTSERSIYRKIKEAFIALMMEMSFKKDDIMGFYLNQIFLGHGTYGVESASQFYFQKHVWELNLAECALLASLPSAPNRFSPIRHPHIAMERHKLVLAKMVELGYISIPDAERAYAEFWPDYLNYINDLPPSYNAWAARHDLAPWFTEHIRRTLIKKYGEEMVYEKGLLVYTTLDLKKQLAAQRVMTEALSRQSAISGTMQFRNADYFVDNFTDPVETFSLLFDISQFSKTGSRESAKVNNYIKEHAIEEIELVNFLFGTNNIGTLFDDYRKASGETSETQKVEGCLISIDHHNGFIVAMVGGSEFTSINQLNRATQAKRQPGSAIKPLLYAAAFDTGKFSPASALFDSPLVYFNRDGGDWIPENYHSQYQGLVRLRMALAQSINVISIRIAEALGIDTVIQYFGKLLKIAPNETQARIPRNLSIAIGSFEVTPFELARAYAIIANGGKDVIPFSIRNIKDRSGKILENQEEQVQKQLKDEEDKGTIQILHPSTCQLMISMLQSVINEGTARAAYPGRPAAGKTGTTNNWRDAWFVGFSPEITTCVWMGYDSLGMSLGVGQAAAGVAAPAWGEYMRLALQGTPVQGFPGYAQLEEHRVCSRSGLNPSGSCRQVISEVFQPGTAPRETCTTCQGFQQSVRLTEKEPTANIIQGQRDAIRKNMNQKKRRGGSVLDHVGDELLK